MLTTGISTIRDTITSMGVAAVGIVGVENVAPIADALELAAGAADQVAAPIDWIEPLIQGVIAVLTVFIQLFRSRRSKRSFDRSQN